MLRKGLRVGRMKVTITLPENLATIFSALAEATGRPTAEILIFALEGFDDRHEPGAFLDEAHDLSVWDEDPQQLATRFAAVYRKKFGMEIPAIMLETWLDEARGAIDEETGCLLREAAFILEEQR